MRKGEWKMNAKYMAVFAAIMMFAGCAVVLVGADASDMDAATNTATKDVYVVDEKEATLKINTTETALGSYANTVSWTYGDEEIAGTGVATSKTASIESGNTEIATASISGSNGSYTFTFTGVAEGTTKATFVYSVTTDISDAKDDVQNLVQTIEYTINLTVLPASFTATCDSSVTFNNRDAVGPVVITYTVAGSDEKLAVGDYYFYAVGLPKGLAMDDEGTIRGTPDVDESDFGNSDTKSYPVTIVATHQASNLAIYSTLTLELNKNSDAFEFEIGVENTKVSDTIYKVIRGDKDNTAITITTKVGGTAKDITSVTMIKDENGTVTQAVVDGEDGEYTFTAGNTTGTGVYIIHMVNGSVSKDITLYVVEPLADVVADIGFTPGAGNTSS